MSVSHRVHARCACASSSGPFVLAGTERKYERSRPFAISHLDLFVDVDFANEAISARAVLDFTRRAPKALELELDAVGFEIARVRLDAGKGLKPAEYVYDGDVLAVSVPKGLSNGKVEVAYRAKPKRGLYFLSPDDTVRDRPQQMWSQCQDEDARQWFPCHDKPHVKMTTSVTVQTPPGFTALSNGNLTKKETPRGKKPWTYRFEMPDPLPSYLVTLVVGRFEIIEDRPAVREGRESVPVQYYVPEGRAADGRRAFGETPRMIELFGRLTGVPYPYARYSQIVVKDFVFGGMENTTATTMYEHVLLDERAALDITSNDLVAHELAHHWFGDYVTCRDWSHAWLNEGFATYFEHVEREDRLGRDEYENGVAGDVSTYLGEAGGRYQRPIVCRDYDEPIDLFDRHLYEKGGLVLHMLRRELGDDLFWKGVKLYLTRHGGSIVETNDLSRALEEVSGRSLERFFDQWVFRPGHPVLKVQITWEDGHVNVRVRQTQKSGDVPLFAFPLEVEIGTKAGKIHVHEKWIESESDALVVPVAERPAWVAFDPQFRVIGAISVEAPADMLRTQLARASTARLRVAAAQALEKRLDPETVSALGAALAKKSEAWMVRAEAARVLGKIRGEAAFAHLAAAVEQKHPKVRRAVASALGEFHDERAAAMLARLAAKDPSYLVGADAARALGETRQPSALKALLAALGEASWADVKRAGALDGLASLRDESAVKHVLERTRYGHSTPTRRAAVTALARLTEDRKVREHLEDLLDDRDPHFRISVIRALELLADGRSRSALRRRLEREFDGRVARRIREALRTMGQGATAEQKRMADEMEQLKRDLGELKVRLAKVEDQRKARRKHGKVS
ncbi:MAG TPA: M1 family aminopeptidase [Polyangiaceae bacterium]|nr:M1 family aminopeptidase [Polyangiaceae bacterium]